MGYIKQIQNNFVKALKETFFQKLVRKQPVIVKDVASNLLKEKRALVTGGNSGIGLSIAKKMKECGAQTVSYTHLTLPTICSV